MDYLWLFSSKITNLNHFKSELTWNIGELIFVVPKDDEEAFENELRNSDEDEDDEDPMLEAITEELNSTTNNTMVMLSQIQSIFAADD